MRAHIVYFSPCGGSRKVARALGSGLQALERDLTKLSARANPLAFGEEDFVIFSFPVYGGRMPRNIKEIFSGLQGNGAACALMATYGNRAWEGALIDLYEAATASGFRPVGAVAAIAEHSLAPQIAAKRPDATDAEKLKAYGERLFEAAEKGNLLAKAPGAMPNWEVKPGMHLFPTTGNAECSQCGACVKVCPVGAIKEPDSTNLEICILCGACSRHCPTGARMAGDAKSREYFGPHLASAAAKRREPELFL